MFYKLIAGGMVAAAAGTFYVTGGTPGGSWGLGGYDVAASPAAVYDRLVATDPARTSNPTTVDGERIMLTSDFDPQKSMTVHVFHDGKPLIDTTVKLTAGGADSTHLTIEDQRLDNDLTSDQRNRARIYGAAVRMVVAQAVEPLDAKGAQRVKMSAGGAVLPAMIGLMGSAAANARHAELASSPLDRPSAYPQESRHDVTFEPGQPMVTPTGSSDRN